MKTLLLTITILLTLSSSFAETSTNKEALELSPAIQSLIDSGVETSEGKFSTEDKRTNCYAYTQCRGGYTVSCQAYGQGCTFRAVRGVGVSCTGYDGYGYWTSWTERCY